MKKFFIILLSVVTLGSAAAVFPASAQAEVKDVLIRQFTLKEYNLKKPKSLKYYAKVKYNENKNISVKFADNGESWNLRIKALAETTGKKPVVKIYYRPSKNKMTVVKSLRFRVKPLGTVGFKNVIMNEGVRTEFSVNNPFISNYSFKLADESVAGIGKTARAEGNKRFYFARGKKQGSTEVEVYLRGVKAGSFKLTVGDFPTTIKPDFSEVTLKYSPKGSSTYMQNSHLEITDILNMPHKADYWLVIDDEDVVSAVDDTFVYATGAGVTTVTVYETIGENVKPVGVMSFKCVNAKMAYVAKQNKLFYEDGVFGNGDSTEYLDLKTKKTLKMKPVIIERLLNNTYTGSSFKSSDYTLSFKSTNTKVATVSSDGVVTSKKVGKARIYYTITFTDGSVFSSMCRIVVDKD